MIYFFLIFFFPLCMAFSILSILNFLPNQFRQKKTIKPCFRFVGGPLSFKRVSNVRVHNLGPFFLEKKKKFSVGRKQI